MSPAETRLWMIWAAILFSQLIFGAMAFFVIQGGAGAFPGLGSPLFIPLAAMAGLLAFVSAATHLVANSEEKLRQTAQNLRAQGVPAEAAKTKLLTAYQQKLIIGLALGEGVTIFGFLLAFLKQISLNTFIIFLGVGLLLHMVGYPKIGTLRKVFVEEIPVSLSL